MADCVEDCAISCSMCCSKADYNRRQAIADKVLLPGRPFDRQGFEEWRIVPSRSTGKGKGRPYFWNSRTGAVQAWSPAESPWVSVKSTGRSKYKVYEPGSA